MVVQSCKTVHVDPCLSMGITTREWYDIFLERNKIPFKGILFHIDVKPQLAVDELLKKKHMANYRRSLSLRSAKK